jgi:hypothetical protein
VLGSFHFSFYMAPVIVSLHSTTIIYALHSFAISVARLPCYGIASHGYIVSRVLIALHGFAGWD